MFSHSLKCGIVSYLIDEVGGKGNSRTINLWPKCESYEGATHIIVLKRIMTEEGPHYQYLSTGGRTRWEIGALPTDIKDLLVALVTVDDKDNAAKGLLARVAILEG
mmetsp:Transcript_34541/g.80022  ORF Transcript_34541/g.80022 Transcript_34541/m.80022 type:complete len:106 (+) Transcript_34541:116-433(+)